MPIYLVAILSLTVIQDRPSDPEFSRAWMAQRLGEILTRYQNREERFFRNEIRLPSDDDTEATEFLDDLTKHPVEDFLLQLESFEKEARSFGYASLEASAIIERILLRGKYVGVSTDVSFIEPLLTTLAETHIQSPSLRRLAENYETLAWMIGDAPTLSFLRTLSEQSPHLTVQAGASLSLSRLLIDQWHMKAAEDETKQALESEITSRLTDIGNNHPYSAEADEASLELYAFKNLRVGGRPEPLTKDFRAADHNSSELSLNAYQSYEDAQGMRRAGRVILLDFWGQWCGPSQQRLMENKSLLKRYERRPFVAVSINSDSGTQSGNILLEYLLKSGLADWMGQHEIVWHHIPDESPTGPVAREWNIRQWPSNFVLDSEGVIRARNVWGEELQQVIDHWIIQCEEDIFAQRHVDLRETPRRSGGKFVTLGDHDGYLATPEAAATPVPGAILIPDAYGLTDHIKLWADRLTTLGLSALVIDPFSGLTAETEEAADKLRSKALSPEVIVERIGEAIQFLSSDASIKSDSVLLMGWGFGGDFALDAAQRYPRAVGTIIFGSPFHNDFERSLEGNNKPLLMFVGNKDQCWSRSLLAKATTAAGTDPQTDLIVYDAPARFHLPPAVLTSGEASDGSDDHHPYDAPSSIDAWRHITQFVREFR